jgi:protein tyrosine phosphatase (PTP) superfamily phosphohydrolase (DUF442 family)
MTDALQRIQQFLPISDNLATAGQPSIAQFKDIQSAGYQLVINLAMPNSSDAIVDEAAIVESLGMIYLSIPVIWENPILDDLEKLFDALDANKSTKVFLHCAKNMRVSAMLYLYHRLRCSMSHADARVYLDRVWVPNPTWQTFIEATIELYLD